MAVQIAQSISVQVNLDGTATAAVVDLLKHPYGFTVASGPVNWPTEQNRLPLPGGAVPQNGTVDSASVVGRLLTMGWNTAPPAGVTNAQVYLLFS